MFGLVARLGIPMDKEVQQCISQAEKGEM